jgi:hypothetical protein
MLKERDDEIDLDNYCHEQSLPKEAKKDEDEMVTMSMDTFAKLVG